MVVVLLSVKEFPFEVSVGELLLEIVNEILVVILLGIHLNLDVPELFVQTRVEFVVHLGEHAVLQVQVDILRSLLPRGLSERDEARLEAHYVAFLAECALIPLLLVLREVLGAVLQVDHYLLAVDQLALHAVNSRSTHPQNG
jgi:hypothetical protein